MSQEELQPSEMQDKHVNSSFLNRLSLFGAASPDWSSDVIREQVAGVAAGLSQHFRPGVDLPRTGNYANVKPTKVDVNASTQDAYNYLVNTLHYKPEHAIGIVANLCAESGCNPHGPAGDGGVAIGICQWHPDRQRNCRNALGFDLRDANLHQQLDFLDWELHHTESDAGDKLWRTTDPRDAAAVFSSAFERPLDRAGNAISRASMAAGMTARLENNTAPLISQNAPLDGSGGPVVLYNFGRNDVGSSPVLNNPEKYRYDVTRDLTQLSQSGNRVVMVLPLSERASGGLNQGVEDARTIAADVTKKLKAQGCNITIVDLHGEQISRGADRVHPKNYKDVSTLLEQQLVAIGVKPTDQIIAVGDSILHGTVDNFKTRFHQYNNVENLAIDGAHADAGDSKHEKQLSELARMADGRSRHKIILGQPEERTASVGPVKTGPASKPNPEVRFSAG